MPSRRGLFRLSDLTNRFAKWRKSKVHQFEMLSSKGYSDNCNTKEQSENQMGKCNPEAAEDYPDQIHNGRQAACI